MRKLPVFICYRQVDGMKVAARVHRLLHELEVKNVDLETRKEEKFVLDVYFDQLASAGRDWKEIHEPYLKLACAFIVVCTPGAKLREGDDDWVHRELSWWLQNNDSAPILVDAFGMGSRYVPDQILARWPDAQRVSIIDDEWTKLNPAELAIEEAHARERILGSITGSFPQYLIQELEKRKEQAKALETAIVRQKVHLRRFKVSFSILIVLLAVSLVATWYAVEKRSEASEALEHAREARSDALRQAENANKNAKRALIAAREATGRQLATESIASWRDMRGSDIERPAAALAIEAWRRFPTHAAFEAVSDALRKLPIVQINHGGLVRHTTFSLDGKLFATSSNVDIFSTLNGETPSEEHHVVRLFDAFDWSEISRIVHDDEIRAVAFSPDGTHLATASDDGTTHIVATADGRAIHRVKHDGWIRRIAFSPDGTKLATGSFDNSVKVTRVADGKKIGEFLHDDDVYDVAFSRASERFATAGRDGTIALINTSNWQIIRRIKQDDQIRHIAFSPDGNLIASGDSKGMISILNAADGSALTSIEPDGWHSVNSLVFSPSSNHLVVTSGGVPGYSIVIQIDEGHKKFTYKKLKHDNQIDGLALSPDGKYFATSTRRGTVSIFRFGEITSEVERISHYGPVVDLAFDQHGTRLITGSEGSVRDKSIGFAGILDVTNGNEIARIEHDGQVYLVTAIPNGTRFVSASGKSVQVFDASDAREVAKYNYNKRIEKTVFSPNGNRFSATSDDTTLIVDPANGREIYRINHDVNVREIVFSADGSRLAIAGHDGVRIVNAIEGGIISYISLTNSVWSVSFNPDGSRFATASSDGVRVFDTTHWQEKFHNENVGENTEIVFSPDGKRIAVAYDGAWILDAETGTQIAHVNHSGGVGNINFGANGTRLITGSIGEGSVWIVDSADARVINKVEDIYVVRHVYSSDGTRLAVRNLAGTVKIVNVEDGSEISTIDHENPVVDFIFSPNNKILATASEDGVIRTFNIKNGQEVLRVRHDPSPRSLAFSPDSSQLAAISADNVRILDSRDGREIARFHDSGEFKRFKFSPDGQRIAFLAGDRSLRIWRTPDNTVEALCTIRQGRNLNADEWLQYLGSLDQWAPTCTDWDSETHLLEKLSEAP